MNRTIPSELHAALSAAVATALLDLAGAGCAAADRAPETDLYAALPVTNPAGLGAIVLALPDATARALARRVLAEAAVEPDAGMVRDCAGEIVNVICGQAKTLLAGTPYHFDLGTPHVAGPASFEAWDTLAFDSDAGPFALHFQVPG